MLRTLWELDIDDIHPPWILMVTTSTPGNMMLMTPITWNLMLTTPTPWDSDGDDTHPWDMLTTPTPGILIVTTSSPGNLMLLLNPKNPALKKLSHNRCSTRRKLN